MIRTIICLNSLIGALLASVFLAYPSGRAILNLRDPAFQGPGIPRAAWRLEQSLTPRYAAWAQSRVVGGRAEKLAMQDISGTEWPLFGSVFYLWAVENLQAAWEGGDHTAGVEPREFCRDVIVAASDLVVDPGHAAWVRGHWGTNYLHHENVFYRMLVIAALTSREKLLHDGAHPGMLRDQVETFAHELDASKGGLLEDYPGECYPGDVMAAIACIRRADAVLGTNHAPFARRAVRAFTGPRATRLQLPPYQAHAVTGAPASESRGCANSYFGLTAPELWPAQAKVWFQLYEKYFWQERFGFAGFREYPNTVPGRDWTMDVDSGPVIAGFGVAANAFGIGAARKNGRFDLAYPISAEMLATIWELPNGTLALPRLLSNSSDAPMLGEAAILWLMSIPPEKGFPVKSGGSIPVFVYAVICTALIFAIGWLVSAVQDFTAAVRDPAPVVLAARFQCVLWAFLMLGALAVWGFGGRWISLALLLSALLIPRCKKPPVEDESESIVKKTTAPMTEENPAAPAGPESPGQS